MPVGVAPQTDEPGKAQNFRAINDSLESVLNEIWLPCADFGELDGPARQEADAFDSIKFSGGADKSAYASFRVWPWWTKGELRDIALWVAILTSSSGNVVWRIDTALAGDGDDVSAINSSESITVAVPGSPDTMDKVTGFSPISITAGVPKVLGIRLFRMGTDAADSSNEAMYLLGVSARFYEEARR